MAADHRAAVGPRAAGLLRGRSPLGSRCLTGWGRLGMRVRAAAHEAPTVRWAFYRYRHDPISSTRTSTIFPISQHGR